MHSAFFSPVAFIDYWERNSATIALLADKDRLYHQSYFNFNLNDRLILR